MTEAWGKRRVNFDGITEFSELTELGEFGVGRCAKQSFAGIKGRSQVQLGNEGTRLRRTRAGPARATTDHCTARGGYR
jgi:hypothetical protein